jgi:hypothetical protein
VEEGNTVAILGKVLGKCFSEGNVWTDLKRDKGYGLVLSGEACLG